MSIRINPFQFPLNVNTYRCTACAYMYSTCMHMLYTCAVSVSQINNQSLHDTCTYMYKYLIVYISHLSILLYYTSRCTTRIFSLPEGYKGKYKLYFPPSGMHDVINVV